MQAKKRKMEFSKKIVLIFAVLEIAVVVFSCIMMWITRDLTPLTYMIPSVSVVGSAGVASYFNKAKLENKIKLMKALDVDITEQAFVDNIY